MCILQVQETLYQREQELSEQIETLRVWHVMLDPNKILKLLFHIHVQCTCTCTTVQFVSTFACTCKLLPAPRLALSRSI